jgi:REP element-mobilizing transposase RayT
MSNTSLPVQYDPSTYVGYFDPQQPIGELQGNLPHWRQEAVTYCVTFRLADSIPQATLDLWVRERNDWLRRHPEPRDARARGEYYRLFVERIQKWLDAGHGACVLGQPPIRKIVAGALAHFDMARYVLREWVVMPNHVHAIVTPVGEQRLSDIIHSWKSYTANEINRVLGRMGTLWQKEPFDHIVRGPDQLARIEQYIHDNPRGLPADRCTLRCLHREGCAL